MGYIAFGNICMVRQTYLSNWQLLHQFIRGSLLFHLVISMATLKAGLMFSFLCIIISFSSMLYGDYFARPHDPKWDVNLPMWSRLLLSAGVMVGHWLAAFEVPELHLIPGGWSNLGIWALIITTLLMQYNATLYLAKYSENVAEPTSVVQFGPYRWVRHPIYSSTMLLFVTYCIALQAPLSLLFIVAVCLLYYKQKAEREEDLMVETFGQSYTEYASKVNYKLIPFIY